MQVLATSIHRPFQKQNPLAKPISDLNRNSHFLPDDMRLSLNPVDDEMRMTMYINRECKTLATLPDRDIAVLTKVKVTRDILPASTQAIDTYDLVRNYVLAKNVEIKELQAAINSTVRIPGAYTEEGGSGIIVNHRGEKYLLTALHISSVKNLVLGLRDNISVYLGEKEFTVNKNQRVYPSVQKNKIIPSRNIPLADIAVFRYDGECEGISLGINRKESIEPLFAVGFPSGEWKYLREEGPSPLVSFGFAAPEKRVVQNISHVQDLFGVDEYYPQARKLFYTGASLPGNSGCPLVDLNGRLKAILCGSIKTSDVSGYTILFPPNDIFEAMSYRLAA